MNKEIEIPEGYEARIEGNKVILVQKDERIRKALIKQFSAISVETWAGIPKIDIISWLERQKEQKPINIDFVSDWLRKHAKAYINSEYNEFHKTVEYDGSISIERLIEDLRKATEQQPFAHENDFARRPEEWDEEDEHCIELLDTIIDSSALIPKNRIKCHAFLKSLRPQLKQDWSEEDEGMLRIIEDVICTSEGEVIAEKHGFRLTNLADWLENLKSQRPQPN